MSGIYLSNGGNNSLNLIAVESLLNSILPPTVRPNKSFTTQSGFRLNYPNEADVNHFFSAEVLTKLQELHLIPDLCHETQKHRLVIIPHIERESFYKGNPTLLNQLSQLNDLNIIKVDTFSSRNNPSRRFIKIFLTSHKAQSNLIKKGRIILDQVSYRAEAPHPEKNSAESSHPRPSAMNHRNIPNVPQGQSALPCHSTWGDQSNITQLNQQQVSHQRSSPDPRVFAFNCSRLSEVLYQGLESPEDYIFIFNNTLIYNGFSAINVPKFIIDKSKNIFHQKRTLTKTNHPPPSDPTPLSPKTPQNPSVPPPSDPTIPPPPSDPTIPPPPYDPTIPPPPSDTSIPPPPSDLSPPSPETPDNPSDPPISLHLPSSSPIRPTPCSPSPSSETSHNPSAPPESPHSHPPTPQSSRSINSPSNSIINPLTSSIPSMTKISNLPSAISLIISPFKSSIPPTSKSSNAKTLPPLSSLHSIRNRSHTLPATAKPNKS